MQTAPTAAQAIEIARAIEARGWKPTPLHVVGPDGATCSCPKGGGCGRSAGKHNIASNWQSDLRGSEIFVEMASGAPKPQGGHWPQRRKMNIGILTGTASGIMVLDIDPKDGGMESMHALLERHGQLPPTFIAQTGTGGWHFYFAMPDFEVRNSASSIAPGVDFFKKLKAAGNFSPVSATGATIKAGTTPVVFNWDYLNLPSYVGVSNWKVFVPQGVALGGYYTQAINKQAPHPAAARLWEEFLYSQAASGGQNLWIEGGARPVEQVAMQSNSSLNAAAAGKLPSVSGSPVFLTQAQNTDAANYLAANWAKAVG